MALENVSSNYTSFDVTGDPLVTYDLTGPIDNVAATIKIVKEETPDWIGILRLGVIAAMAIVGIVTVTVVLVRKPRKKDTSASSNPVSCLSCF